MKSAIEDHHRDECNLQDSEVCASCALSTDEVDEWDKTHRAASILKMFNDKSIKEIIKDKGWTTSVDETLVLPGNFIQCTKSHAHHSTLQ